jgi:hypothetical protein
MIFCCDLQVEAMFHSDNIKPKDKAFNAIVALRFMDGYAKFCNSHQRNVDHWVKCNTLLTERFKSAYKKMIDDAYRADPEVGLDFDPIFDAQDYPEKGFKVLKYDSASGYVTLCGKNWREFVVTVKVVFQNNRWLVDGAGIINIPKDKQRVSRYNK